MGYRHARTRVDAATNPLHVEARSKGVCRGSRQRPQAGHRRVAGQGAHHRGLPRGRLRRRGLGRAYPRPAQPQRAAGRHEEGPVRQVRRRRGQRLRGVLRRGPGQTKKVAELKRALKDADELYLATDEDREGEAIAWHLLEALKPRIPVKRMVFHEITREAIQRAVDDTRELDSRLVDAQETRRILDRLRLRGLARPVAQGPPGLVGRPGPVRCHRMVVERERERMAFVSRPTGTSRPTSRRRPAASRSPPG